MAIKSTSTGPRASKSVCDKFLMLKIIGEESLVIKSGLSLCAKISRRLNTEIPVLANMHVVLHHNN